MTLQEAIAIMENDPPMPHPLDLDKIDEAERLSIEALKRLIEIRSWHPAGTDHLLPGETP